MFTNTLLLRLFPFLSWLPVNSALLRGDLVAGIIGALVLVPKAMAYAQLSGLPVYFGLYTAFIPAILGALWGSSRQLLTGPVAIISLMTAAAVAPLAVPMSEEYIGLALLLSLLVGIILFVMGTFKLGTIVNFVSHPVILGFINAAAIIIALSQLDLLLGIPKGRSNSFLKDIWEMLAYLPQTHLPTLAMSVFALAMMLIMKKIKALAKPSVLIVVVVTTLISFAFGYAHNAKGKPDDIANEAIHALVMGHVIADDNIRDMSADITAKATELRAIGKSDTAAIADLEYQLDLMRLAVTNMEQDNKERMQQLHKINLSRTKAPENERALYYLAGSAPAGIETDSRKWHIKKIENGEIKFVGGGDVVGTIPAGLPGMRVPSLSFDAVVSLLSAALIIALVGFMETVSMAKALAAQTKQRLDPNQELIGQGLANMGGAFFQSYPSCGSFTGSAINLQAGAKTGLASTFNGIFVAVTLLFLTPLLYYLPKAVLAVIILLAVVGLITPAAIKHTWLASRKDGITALITFFATLIFAPHLDKGIMIGAVLAIVMYLYETMQPRVAILGRYHDGTLRDAKINNLPPSDVVTAVRFDGSLYFANVAYFEDAILEAVATNPKAPYLLIVANGINEMDASGEEVMHHLVERLHGSGVTVVFSGLKKQVIDVMLATGLFDQITQANIHATAEIALEAIYAAVGEYHGQDALRPLQAG